MNGAVKREYADLSGSRYTERVGSAKSESGIRVIPFADSAAQALRICRDESQGDLLEEHRYLSFTVRTVMQ